jgi:NAD(P)-dependent dehydrogenase (short-subunit alcohol dehydrogenase family)
VLVGINGSLAEASGWRFVDVSGLLNRDLRDSHWLDCSGLPERTANMPLSSSSVSARKGQTGVGNRLAGKVAVVTGAGSGIGRATALRFASEGAAVALLTRSPDSGATAEAEVLAAGAEAIFIEADVSIESDVAQAIHQVREYWGRIDVMFNAAGISGRSFGDGPVADCSLEGWDRVISANLTSMFLCSKYGVAAMLDNGGGSLINLSSVLGLVGGDEDFATHAYAASKGGIVAMTRAIASFYAPRNVRANVIAPGLIRTKMSRRAQSDQRIVDRLDRLQPLTSDFGEAEDVAAAALYLASDESRFVTGIVLPVDGGWTTR